MTTLFIVVSNVSAYACSCGFKDMPFNDLIKASEIVFIGTPIETKPVNPEEDCFDISHLHPGFEPFVHCRGEMVTRFKIATPIKGDIGETFDVQHGIRGASCGVSFKLNKLTFIHTSARKAKYSTNYCSRARLSLETFQAYAETSPEERNCMEQISAAYEPIMEKASIAYKDPSTKKEPYNLSMLNLAPVCEVYLPTYLETFGSKLEKAFHAIISAPVEPVRLEPEMRYKKEFNSPARPVFKYLISLALFSLAVLVMLIMRRRAMSS